jgi:putative transcriptional regulator
MALRRYAHLIFALATMALPGLLCADMPRSAAQTATDDSLAGRLLIAAPALDDPNFEQTVVLIVQHDARGAFGIVINRPLGERSLAELLIAFGDRDPSVAGNVQIHAGGPVQPQLGFVIHSSEYRRPETVEINGRLAMTPSREILRDIGTNKGPQKKLVALGYAGWGPRQLEWELLQKAWLTAPADSKLIFDDDRDKVWNNAMANRPVDL